MQIDDYTEIKLILNISEFDYKTDQLRLLNCLGNFLVDPSTNVMYEISSDQVKDLLSVNRVVPFVLEFQKQKSSKMAGMSPKAFLKSAMQTLWAMSN